MCTQSLQFFITFVDINLLMSTKQIPLDDTPESELFITPKTTGQSK